MTNKEIAQTIWEQMKTIDANLVMCMGVKSLTVIENGLEFKVNGLSFKGNIQIILNGKDLYDVNFIKFERHYYVNDLDAGIKRYVNLPKVVDSVKDLFVEDLMPFLESKVESRKAI